MPPDPRAGGATQPTITSWRQQLLPDRRVPGPLRLALLLLADDQQDNHDDSQRDDQPNVKAHDSSSVRFLARAPASDSLFVVLAYLRLTSRFADRPVARRASRFNHQDLGSVQGRPTQDG